MLVLATVYFYEWHLHQTCKLRNKSCLEGIYRDGEVYFSIYTRPISFYKIWLKKIIKYVLRKSPTCWLINNHTPRGIGVIIWGIANAKFRNHNSISTSITPPCTEYHDNSGDYLNMSQWTESSLVIFVVTVSRLRQAISWTNGDQLPLNSSEIVSNIKYHSFKIMKY